MPLPWKTKVNRISKLVSDLQTPKQGGSFVVQTGFPTSLIDLIFKNRDHLKKPPSKKNKNKKKHKKRNQSVNRVGDWIAADSELGSSNFESSAKPSSPKVETLSLKDGDYSREAVKFEDLGEAHVEDLDLVGEDRVGGGNWNSVLMAVLKMFAVVALALTTKKLAVGIALSAFLLLFLEYAGKKLTSFLRPCSNAKSVFRNMAQRVSQFLLFLSGFDESEDLKGVSVREKTRNVVFELVDERSAPDSAKESVSDQTSIDFLGERSEPDSAVESVGDRTLIEFLGENYEEKRAVEKENVGGKSLNELLGMDCEQRKVLDKRRAYSDKTGGMKSTSLVKLLGTDYEKIKVPKGDEDGGEDKKSKGNKNSQIKSKLIKKFVPKKFRKKGKQNELELQPLLNTEISGFTVEDKLGGCEDLEDHKAVKQEGQESENISVFSLEIEAKSEYQGFDELSDHGDAALAGDDTPSVVEKKGIEGQGGLGYLILFFIVLAGLFGGRIVALMLTIGCCFMPKLAASLRRFVKYAHGKVFCSNLKLEYLGLS